MNRKNEDLLQSDGPIHFEEHSVSLAAIAAVSAVMTFAALVGVLAAL